MPDDVGKLPPAAQERQSDDEPPCVRFSLDGEGRILEVNPHAAELLGCTVAELRGQPFSPLFVDTRRAEVLLRRAAAGETVTALELELRRKGGSSLCLNLWLSPARQSDGVEKSRCIGVDVTDYVRAGAECTRLKQYHRYLQEEIKSVHNFEQIIGQSSPLRAVLDKVRLAASTETAVLIHGETGTGKELIARAVHSLSKRKDRPLIKVNCAAQPSDLLEKELFGVAPDALAGRVSKLELAHEGTIFLDEIGEISLEVQARLLHLMQDREFEPVGGVNPIKVNVRILAATNRDLRRAVREKLFREDLYFRLTVIPIHMPPLRDRREDVPLLAQFLVNKFAAQIGKRIEGINPATLERLRAYAWPGNVRELENILERAVLLASGPTLDISPDILALPATVVLPGAEVMELAALERHHIRTVLERTRWVIDGPHGAARLLGLHPNTLRSRLKKLGLQRPGHEPS